MIILTDTLDAMEFLPNAFPDGKEQIASNILIGLVSTEYFQSCISRTDALWFYFNLLDPDDFWEVFVTSIRIPPSCTVSNLKKMESDVEIEWLRHTLASGSMGAMPDEENLKDQLSRLIGVVEHVFLLRPTEVIQHYFQPGDPSHLLSSYAELDASDMSGLSNFALPSSLLPPPKLFEIKVV